MKKSFIDMTHAGETPRMQVHHGAAATATELVAD
jgi:hypothetical protein